jgi:hypothetical protein
LKASRPNKTDKRWGQQTKFDPLIYRAMFC